MPLTYTSLTGVHRLSAAAGAAWDTGVTANPSEDEQRAMASVLLILLDISIFPVIKVRFVGEYNSI